MIGPEDAGYDEARALFNAMIDKRPALIARCASAEDVASVIAFAREHDVPLAIRGGGHNGGGLGSVDDGVVDRSVAAEVGLGRSGRRDGARRRRRDVGRGRRRDARARARRSVRDHLDDRRRRADARRRDRAPDARLRPDDRQPARGARSCWPTASQVTASADENADLFWALRGGGGNFGVVTEFTFRAHPVTDIVGGPTFWAIEETDELLAAYREYLPTLPRNVDAASSASTPSRPGRRSRRRSTCARCAGSSGASSAPTRRPSRRWRRCWPSREPLMHGVAARCRCRR